MPANEDVIAAAETIVAIAAPATSIATAFLASELEIDAATCAPVVPASKGRALPSGKARVTWAMASAAV